MLSLKKFKKILAGSWVTAYIAEQSLNLTFFIVILTGNPWIIQYIIGINVTSPSVITY